jgi:hypothetical protein
MPIDLDEKPLALYIPYTQTWKLTKYTRGRLVNSFTLSPGETMTVEVFTWDRLRSSLETTSVLESEQDRESSSSRRDANDVTRDVTRQSGFEVSTNGKVGFQIGVVNADFGANMDARTSVNEADRSTRNTITEATIRSTNRVRVSRTLKVTDSRETGREERVTR